MIASWSISSSWISSTRSALRGNRSDYEYRFAGLCMGWIGTNSSFRSIPAMSSVPLGSSWSRSSTVALSRTAHACMTCSMSTVNQSRGGLSCMYQRLNSTPNKRKIIFLDASSNLQTLSHAFFLPSWLRKIFEKDSKGWIDFIHRAIKPIHGSTCYVNVWMIRRPIFGANFCKEWRAIQNVEIFEGKWKVEHQMWNQ